MPVGEAVVEMILDLVRACRPGEPEALALVNDTVSWGPGPRAAQALMLSVRARALLDGRLAPSPEDVLALARPVLSHRMALSFAARARGESLARVIDGGRRRGHAHRGGGLTAPNDTSPSQPAGGLRHGAERLAASLPPLLADAEHLASTVMLGEHGRRRPGMGDEFWQYRPRIRAILRAPSTGGVRPSRMRISCANANGRRRRLSCSGSMTPVR
jgi:hypothetical protein